MRQLFIIQSTEVLLKLINMRKKNILVFASGDKDGGGSGFQEMVERSRTKPAILDANIVGVISNHANGGVYKKAKALGVPFRYFPGLYTAENYQAFVKEFAADYVMLSGWLKPVLGLQEKRTINIHPGPLPEFGGKGMYGHHVHEAVIAAFKRGELKESAVSMHFVNEKYDEGHGIVRIPVLIRDDDDAESLAARVLKVEHNYQSLVLNEIVNGQIALIEDAYPYIRFRESVFHRFYFRNKKIPELMKKRMKKPS